MNETLVFVICLAALFLASAVTVVHTSDRRQRRHRERARNLQLVRKDNDYLETSLRLGEPWSLDIERERRESFWRDCLHNETVLKYHPVTGQEFRVCARCLRLHSNTERE